MVQHQRDIPLSECTQCAVVVKDWSRGVNLSQSASITNIMQHGKENAAYSEISQRR